MRACHPAWVERLLTSSAQYASLLRPTCSHPGGFVGAFCFLREAFEPPAQPFPAGTDVILPLQHLERPIRLPGPQNAHTHRSRNKIGHLKPGKISFLVREHNLERKFFFIVIFPVTYAPEFQFQLRIFFFAALFASHGSSLHPLPGIAEGNERARARNRALYDRDCQDPRIFASAPPCGSRSKLM